MPVERFQLEARPFQGGRLFGSAGALEELSGRVFFALDPAAQDIGAITDLSRVPVDADGRVRFSATFSILRPADPIKRNGRLFMDMPNRGGTRLLRNTNITLPPPLNAPGDTTADGWLLRQGYSVVSCGWQHDAPYYPGALRAELPEALIDGERIRGPVICHLEAFHRTEKLPIGHYGHHHYEVADPHGPATLKVRDYIDASPTIISRERWDFAGPSEEGASAGSSHILYPDGFRPGKLYELEYVAVGAVPTALGLVGVRDFLSFLRFGAAEDGNPCAGEVDRIYGFGASQPGGVLRVMDELNLFQDATGRPLIDGYIAHGAGAFKSEVNWRFGQMSPFGPRTAGFVPPFGCASDSRAYAPKAIYTNSGPDYWDMNAALCHVNADGGADLQLPERVRMFYLAGQPHVRGAVSDVAGTSMIVHAVNTIDFAPFLRAAIVNLDLWVRVGTPFPPSRIPTLAAGTLIDRSEVLAKVAKAVGHSGPLHPATPRVLNFGPRMNQRIMDHAPELGATYPMLAGDVDADGNDADGLLHPEVAVPLATYAPWNVQGRESGAPGEGACLAGAMLPFAFAGDKSAGDGRRTISERYASRQAYLHRVREAVRVLIMERMLLAEDEGVIVEAAGQRWDLIVAAAI